MTKYRRNERCFCGSGKKYKRCHGDPLRGGSSDVAREIPDGVEAVMRQHQANEAMRVKQQGLGRPIISGMIGDHRFVAARNRLYYSNNWKSFTEFLLAYMKSVLGLEWGAAELAKPFEERHPILQWAEALAEYQRGHGIERGDSAPLPGVGLCFYGLAYSLYLIDHNVDLQDRLVTRLKAAGQFQGAYYELMVANCLIRAGFELQLEDESDGTTGHCEFSTCSKRTGTRYSVEAKARAVPNVLGKSDQDGSPSANPTSRLTKHLTAALRKPAPHNMRRLRRGGG